MILFNCNSFLQGAYSIREQFINLCNIELLNLQKRDSLGLNQLLEKYDISDIRLAFRQINVDKDGYLIIPEQTKSSIILRFLEYGGDDIRPTHLISTVKRDLYNNFAIKEEIN